MKREYIIKSVKSVKKEIDIYSLSSFLPHKLVLSKISNKKFKPFEIFNATILFADISGFTYMSEKLSKLGKEGSEDVNKIINGYFNPLIKMVYKWNGDIYRFGGDAFLSFFPEDGFVLSSERGMNAAIEILNFVKNHSITLTKMGNFKIQIHIAVSKGMIYFQDFKKNYFIGGQVINDLMSIIDFAEPGEIVVNSELKKDLKNILFESKGKVWKYVKKIGNTKPKLITENISLKMIKNKYPFLKEYVPEWLLKKIELKPYFDYKDGEHRKVSVIFLHFTGISYDKNPKKAQQELSNFYNIIDQTVKKYSGWINLIDVYKDSERILVIFGFPNAYEDDEKRSVLFTYEILNHPKLINLKMRAGINSGSVFAAPIGNELRHEYTVLGDAVNLSARFAAKAENKSIVVSESIFNKTFGLFDYEFLGEQQYKGKEQKISVYKIIKKKEIAKKNLEKWLSESEKIIGREKEIEKIRNILGVCLENKGQILAITGEPGIGKSRIVQELIKLSKNSGYHIFQGDCFSFGSSLSYHPWIEILKDFFEILPKDSVNRRASKIKEKSLSIDKKLIDWLPVIGEIMGVPFPETSLTKHLDPKIKKQKSFDIIFDFIKFITKSKPVNIIIEDLHWADSISVELTNYIGRNIKDKKILLTIVFRPVKNKEEFLEKNWTTELIIKELSKEETIDLVKNLLDIKDIPEDLRKIIIEKSQGNPFYIEELIKSLVEQGYVIEENGRWKFKDDVRKLQLPDSVETIILSRIDRLDFQEKEILQIASVLGREFDEVLLEGIIPLSKNLKKALNNLQNFDLIKEEKSKKQTRYFFKHILTQEVAYNTLSFARKKDIHQQAGLFIETKFKNRKDEFLGLLSYHFYEGGDYDRSLLYSVEAGEKSKKVYANEEAIKFFTRAIDSYEKLEGKLNFKIKK